MINLKCPCCGKQLDYKDITFGGPYYACSNIKCQLYGPSNDPNGDKVRRLHLLKEGEAVVRVPKLVWEPGFVEDSETASHYLVYTAADGDRQHRAIFPDGQGLIRMFDTRAEAKAACEDDYRKKWMELHEVIRQWPEEGGGDE